MSAMVVFESYFGNGAILARAMAEALGEGTHLCAVGEAPATIAPDVKLLLLGGPTHALTMSTALTRAAAKGSGGAALDRGIREWIAELDVDDATKVAVYGTQSSKASGSSARAARRALRRRGIAVSSKEEFLVTAQEGPLAAGEVERAAAWARSLLA